VMIINIRRFSIIAALFLLASLECGNRATGSQAQGLILKDVPEKVDRGARYLFYLHGRIIEEQGIRPTSERYGVYEYEKILDALKSRGLVVISEARPKGTQIDEYAAKVINQIQTLLKAGVAPQKITVVGASKGAVIAMVVSMRLKNRDVNFVLMGNCNDGTLRERQVDLWGNVLSIFDTSDDIGGTCQKFFEKAKGLNKRKEVELRTGLGHGYLYRAMNEWIDPAVEWATGH
jgi:acetyl esterase/lipase